MRELEDKGDVIMVLVLFLFCLGVCVFVAVLLVNSATDELIGGLVIIFAMFPLMGLTLYTLIKYYKKNSEKHCSDEKP